MEYYRLQHKKLPSNSAFAVVVQHIETGTETDLVRGKREIPFTLELRNLSLVKGDLLESKDLSILPQLWHDYQPNQFVWPMMSARMTEIVKTFLSGEEGIDWISAPINWNGEVKQYFVPRFAQQLDILDEGNTVYSVDRKLVVNPWYSKEKVARFGMFHAYPEFWEIPSALVVNELLMKALKKGKLLGVGFGPERSV